MYTLERQHLIITFFTIVVNEIAKAQVKRRTSHEPYSLKTMDNEAAFFDVIKYGSCEVRRLTWA